MRFPFFVCLVLFAADCSMSLPTGPRSQYWVVNFGDIAERDVVPRLKQYVYTPANREELDLWIAEHWLRFRLRPDRLIALQDPIGSGYACFVSTGFGRERDVCYPYEGRWRGTDYFLITR